MFNKSSLYEIRKTTAFNEEHLVITIQGPKWVTIGEQWVEEYTADEVEELRCLVRFPLDWVHEVKRRGK